MCTATAPCEAPHAHSAHCRALRRTAHESFNHTAIFVAGAVADSLTPAAYQDLLDRGWRRSGTYLYHPRIHRACCPHYTIRTHACELEPSASQRRALRKFDLFLDGSWAKQQELRAAHNSSTAAVPSPEIVQGPDAGTAGAARAVVLASEALQAAMPVADLAQWQVRACDAAAQFVVDAKCHGKRPRHSADSTLRTQADLLVAQELQGRDSHSGGCGGGLNLTSAVCWQLAAKSAAAQHAGSASSAATPVQSKSAAKKARKRMERAHASACGSGAQQRTTSVADIASQLAEQVLPALQQSLRGSDALHEAVLACSHTRGHLHLCLDPAKLPACPPWPEADGADGGTGSAADAEQTQEPTPHANAQRDTGASGMSSAPGGQPAPLANGRSAAGRRGSACGTDAASAQTDDDSSACSEEDWAQGFPSQTHGAAQTDGADQDRRWWAARPPGGAAWPLRIVLRPSTFLPEEYALWRRYQAAVHKDAPSRLSASSYQRFLVSNPFPQLADVRAAAFEVPVCDSGGWAGTDALAPPLAAAGGSPGASASMAHHGISSGATARPGATDHGSPVQLAVQDGRPSCGFGAFHMQFWIGTHLAAVSVIDILPRCACPRDTTSGMDCCNPLHSSECPCRLCMLVYALQAAHAQFSASLLLAELC